MANFKSRLLVFGRSDIGRALAASLVLHAILLLQTMPGVSRVWSQPGPPPPGNSLDATLRRAIGSAAVPPVSSSSPPVKAPPAQQRQHLPAALPTMRDATSDLASASASPSGTGVAATHLSAGQETITPAGSAALAAPSGDEGLDANGLRQYRLGLAVEARRFKRYPQEALEQGWSGTAHLSVAVAGSGVVQSVRLVNSSGHEVLDAVALDILGKAASHAVVPPSLRGRSFSVPLPVEFRRDPE